MASSPPSATFRILGPLEVVDPSTGVPLDLGGPKQRAVLARLLLSPGVVVPVGRLAAGLWGDDPPASAAGTLQAYVSNLRKVLEPARPSGEAPSVLVTQAPGYLLAIDPSSVDSAVFESLVSQGAAAVRSGSWVQAVESLSAARSLWRGPALAEPAFERFAGAEVARLSELRLQGLEWWAEALLGAGRHAEVVPDLGPEVADHPLRPRLRAALMLALYRSGRQADALRVYREGRTVLRDELGAEPEPELQALEEQILLQDPALDWVPPSRSVRGSGGSADQTTHETDDGVGVLVGRDAERASAERALITAASGRGGVVLVAGEAGIGKTRLAEEVAAAALERGAAVAWGRSFESEGTPAFWPWVEALRQLVPDVAAVSPLLEELGADGGSLVRLLPELAAVAPPAPEVVDDADEAVRFSLYGAVTRFVEAMAGRRPVVVVLDDAHWADAASLRLLRFLGPHLASVRVLVVVTYRQDEVDGELADALAGLAREAEVTRLELGGLTEGDVGRLLSDTLASTPSDAVIRDVAARSAGNPFFVGELARLIGGGGDVRTVPPGVRDVIRRRIDRLPPGADRLLAAAAVGGREFDVDAAASVAELDPDDDATLSLVEAALDAHLLVEAGRLGRYRFTHALVQEALLDSLSGRRRARMHQRIAAVLSARPATGRAEDLAELAIHALEGTAAGASSDEVAAAVGHALVAADAALSALAFEQAASLCSRALSLLPAAGGDDEVRFALALDLGIARRREGDVDGARDALRVALATARSLDDASRFARAAIAFGGGAWWGWWSDVGFVDAEAAAAYEEALERLGPSPSALRVEVLGRLAVELHFDDSAAERREALSAAALAEARSLVAEGSDATSRRALVYALATRHIAVWRPGNAEERRALADELVATARSVRATEAEAFGHHFLFLAALERGDVAGASVQLEEGERLVGLLPLPHLTAQVAWSRSLLAAVAGRFDEAEELQGAALTTTARWSEAEAMRTWSAQLAGLRWDQGRGVELAPALRHRIDVEAINVNWKTGLALLLADAGDAEAEEAAALFDDVAASEFDDVPLDLGRLFNLAVRALTCLLLEDSARAARLLPLLEPYVGGHVVQATRLVYAGPVSFLVGGLRLLAGDLDGGVSLLRQAAGEADRMGARPFAARSRLALARGLEQDSPDEARALATEALAIAEDLGMARVAVRAAQVVARLS